MAQPKRRPAASTPDTPPGAPEPGQDAPTGPTPRDSTPVDVAALANPLDGQHWPATEVELVPVTELAPYARNARTHSDEQVAQIMASIREWGFTTPILRDETGMVIAGHGRLLAAQRLKLTEVPVRLFSTLAVSTQRCGVKDCLCEDCGAEFTARKDTNPKICKRCVSVRGGRAVKGLTRSAYQPCRYCGKPIRVSTEQTYCSVPCRMADKRVERTCRYCGTQFSVLKSTLKETTNSSGNFCTRDCYEHWLCRTDRVTGRGSQWKKSRDEVILRFPVCAVCGTPDNLQVHHITPFRLTRNNHRYNLIPLCVKHHRWVETLFVETEAFGVGLFEQLVWQDMLRTRQRMTAMYLRGLNEKIAA